MWKPASERAMPAAIFLEALLESAQCFITHWLLYLSSSAAAVASRPTSRRDLSRQAGHPQQQGCEMWEACGRCEDGSQKGLRGWRAWQRRARQLQRRLLARSRGRGQQHTFGSERRHSEEERRCGLFCRLSSRLLWTADLCNIHTKSDCNRSARSAASAWTAVG